MYRVREQTECGDVVHAGGGSNITIAVLDTGIANHPDLQGRLLDFHDFTSKREDPYDDSGHGTHVCGIACGNGSLSEGKYRGMATKANLVVGKVLDKRGDGTIDSMLDAIEWVMQKKDELGIRILNVSVGVGQLMNKEKEGILKNKLECAWQKGLLVVCAAGNNGPACESLSAIGRSSYLITVGCHDGDYFKERKIDVQLIREGGALFSTVKKPDIVAPGTEIISCNGHIKKNRNGYSNAYIAKSGTSMATPIISGALALLLQKHPEYDNEMAKRKLLYSANDLKEPWYQQGWGMLNVARMMEE